MLQFDTGVFADFAAVMAASHQVGTGIVIAIDAADTITLQHTKLATLQAHSEAFAFV